MSILRPILSDIRSPILGQKADYVTRYFTSFSSSNDSYIELDSDIVLSGAFSVSVDAVLPSSRGNLVGSDTNDRFELLVNDAGVLVAYNPTNLSFFTKDVSSLIDGKLHRIIAEYDGSEFTVTIDGAAEPPVSVSMPSTRIQFIGAAQPSQPYYEGVIANIKIEQASSIAVDMPIDQDYTPASNVVDNSAGGNNGTFINITDGDSTLYTKEGNKWVDGSGNEIDIAY